MRYLSGSSKWDTNAGDRRFQTRWNLQTWSSQLRWCFTHRSRLRWLSKICLIEAIITYITSDERENTIVRQKHFSRKQIISKRKGIVKQNDRKSSHWQKRLNQDLVDRSLLIKHAQLLNFWVEVYFKLLFRNTLISNGVFIK